MAGGGPQGAGLESWKKNLVAFWVVAWVGFKAGGEGGSSTWCFSGPYKTVLDRGSIVTMCSVLSALPALVPWDLEGAQSPPCPLLDISAELDCFYSLEEEKEEGTL